jgi:hypothetical protein
VSIGVTSRSRQQLGRSSVQVHERWATQAVGVFLVGAGSGDQRVREELRPDSRAPKTPLQIMRSTPQFRKRSTKLRFSEVKRVCRYQRPKRWLCASFFYTVLISIAKTSDQVKRVLNGSTNPYDDREGRGQSKLRAEDQRHSPVDTGVAGRPFF